MDRSLRASDYAKIVRQIGTLATNPGAPENARRRLREPVSWCCAAAWRPSGTTGVAIVGEYRVFYDVDEAEGIVKTRAVRQKRPQTTTGEIP